MCVSGRITLSCLRIWLRRPYAAPSRPVTLEFCRAETSTVAWFCSSTSRTGTTRRSHLTRYQGLRFDNNNNGKYIIGSIEGDQCWRVSSDPACLLCDPGEAAGERRDSDQRVLHHWELQGLHHAAGIRNQTHWAEKDGGHVAGGKTCPESFGWYKQLATVG